MGRVSITVNDGKGRVQRQDMFLPGANVHPAWVRGNKPPLTKIGRNPSVEATRARISAGGLDELDVPPDNNDSLLTGHRTDDDQCNCNSKVAASLAKLADIEELQFFTHRTHDAAEDTLKITVPLLAKLLDWARRQTSEDALDKMVEMLVDESDGGARPLDMQADVE